MSLNGLIKVRITRRTVNFLTVLEIVLNEGINCNFSENLKFWSGVNISEVVQVLVLITATRRYENSFCHRRHVTVQTTNSININSQLVSTVTLRRTLRYFAKMSFSFGFLSPFPSISIIPSRFHVHSFHLPPTLFISAIDSFVS